MDCVCSLAVTVVVASVWRDIWAIIDANILPEFLFESACASAVSKTLLIQFVTLEVMF